jgi:serine protease Do/serine protease DegQ
VGIGFAIPTNLSREVMQQLVTNGKVNRGNLGVETQDINARIAKVLGLKDNNGAVVTRVTSGSAADSADIQVGEVITALNGKPSRNAQDLRNAEGLMPLGSSVKLTVQRNGSARDVTAKLVPEKLATVDGAKLDARLAGVTFSELSQNLRAQGVGGVAVGAVRAGSHAAQAGLQANDIVIGIGNARIPDLRTLQQLAGVNPRQLVLVVSGDEGVRYVDIH